MSFNVRQRSFGLDLLLFIVPLVLLLAAHYFSPWNRGLDHLTVVYKFNVLLRLGSLFSLGIVLVCTGFLFTFVFEKGNQPNVFSVDNFFRGAFLWTLLVFALGAFSFIYFSILISLSGIFLISAWALKETGPYPTKDSHSWPIWAWILVGLISLYYFLKVGMIPQAAWPDLAGHYLPYFQSVSETHSILPSKWHFHFFDAKGACLFHFATTLCDIQAVQLMSLLMIAGMSVATCLFLSQELKSSWWEALYFVLMLFASKVFYAEFAKPHPLVTGFLIYFTLRSFSYFSKETTFIDFWTLVLCLLSLTIMSPTCIPFAVIWVLCLWFSFGVYRKDIGLKALRLVGIMAASEAVILVFNYSVSGFFEIWPPALSVFFNPQRAQQWIDPMALQLQMEWNRILMSRLPSDRIIESLLIQEPLLCLNLILLIASQFKRAELIKERRLATAAVVFQLLTVALSIAVGGSSVQRLTLFCTPLSILANVALIRILTFASRQEPVLPWRAAAMSGVFVVFLFIQWDQIPPLTHWNFLAGNETYTDVYEPDCHLKDALEIQCDIPRGHRVNLLTALPGFLLIPNSVFERVDSPSYLRSFSKIMYGPAQVGQQALRDEKVDYALVEITERYEYSGFAPAYAPDQLGLQLNVAKKYSSQGRTYYLLKISELNNSVDPAERENTEELKPILQGLLEHLQHSLVHLAYDKWKK